ncbi:hypothetical protein D3C84_865970 [compost metagenome]
MGVRRFVGEEPVQQRYRPVHRHLAHFGSGRPVCRWIVEQHYLHACFATVPRCQSAAPCADFLSRAVSVPLYGIIRVVERAQTAVDSY